MSRLKGAQRIKDSRQLRERLTFHLILYAPGPQQPSFQMIPHRYQSVPKEAWENEDSTHNVESLKQPRFAVRSRRFWHSPTFLLTAYVLGTAVIGISTFFAGMKYEASRRDLTKFCWAMHNSYCKSLSTLHLG